MIFILIFLIGIISSLNPHMIGMVPMYMGIILQEKKEGVRTREVICFSISFALMLTILGVIVSSFGASLHPIMRISYIIGGTIYLLLGLKMLGLNLKKLSPIKIVYFYSSNTKKRSLVKNIILPLIFTPCSLPYIISILTLAMLRGSLFYGGLLLFSFGLGHSLIFIVFGLFSDYITNINLTFRYRRVINRCFAVLMLLLAVVFFFLSSNHKGHHM